MKRIHNMHNYISLLKFMDLEFLVFAAPSEVIWLFAHLLSHCNKTAYFGLQVSSILEKLAYKWHVIKNTKTEDLWRQFKVKLQKTWFVTFSLVYYCKFMAISNILLQHNMCTSAAIHRCHAPIPAVTVILVAHIF